MGLARAAQGPAAPQARPQAGTRSLSAVHRSGQTFLTWAEDPQGPDTPRTRYRVYRSRQPIQTLEGLQPLAEVGPDSGAFPRQVAIDSPHQRRIIMEDLGGELPLHTGFYVHTPGLSVPEPAYYAVGKVMGGRAEPFSLSRNLSRPVLEGPGQPRPVLVYQSPNGRQRLYTQFMDDRVWNAGLDGLAYNFWVGLPPGGASRPLPLTLHLHAWGESWRRLYASRGPSGPGSPYDYPTVWLEPDDPSNTWWVGFADRLNDRREPATGAVIQPYTERRLASLLAWIWGPSSGISIDRDRVYLAGGSMGGTGALSFGLRHPDWFAGIYALMPLTSVGKSAWGRAGFASLWGSLEHPFPVSDAPSMARRMDLPANLEAQAGNDLPLMVSIFGRQDQIIDWKTQALPWIAARERATQPGPVFFTDGDHGSVFESFDKVLYPSWRPTAFRLSRRQSYPIFTASSVDDALDKPVPPCRAPDPLYRYGQVGAGYLWGGSDSPVLGRTAPVDQPRRYQLALALRSDLCAFPREGVADVTLRRRQCFLPRPGEVVHWETRGATGRVRQTGKLSMPKESRLTVPGVRIPREGILLTLWLEGDGH